MIYENIWANLTTKLVEPTNQPQIVLAWVGLFVEFNIQSQWNAASDTVNHRIYLLKA